MNYETLEQAVILKNKIENVQRELETFKEYQGYEPKSRGFNPPTLQLSASRIGAKEDDFDQLKEKDFRFNVSLDLLSGWITDLRNFKEAELIYLKRDFEEL